MRRYGIFIVGALAAAVCIRLGVWQLSRLSQRRAWRANVEQRERMFPLDLGALASGSSGSGALVADSLAYRPATVRGTFDFAHQILVTERVVHEVPAVYIVTPLRYEGRAVLVERGWTPSADGYSAPLAVLDEPDTATVTGVLLPLPRGASPDSAGWPLHVRRDDPVTLAGRLPYPLFPLVLRRTRVTGPVPRGLEPIPTPVLDNGPHLSYAIQWFSFAAIAIVGPIIFYWSQRGTPKREA